MLVYLCIHLIGSDLISGKPRASKGSIHDMLSGDVEVDEAHSYQQGAMSANERVRTGSGYKGGMF